MSQTNTNTNNGHNRNQNSRRGGQDQGGSDSGGRGDCRNDCGNKLIAKYSFEGKMKDSPIFKLLITETGHRPTQYKKIIDTFPYHPQIRTTEASMMLFGTELTKLK